MSIESEEFMQAALLEGRRALPLCLPNPPVGCVLVKTGSIIARGHTQPPGLHHAEAMALSQVSGDLTEVTAYVTLEPCSFQGRTPSCAQALVASDIKRVVVAISIPILAMKVPEFRFYRLAELMFQSVC